LNEAPAVASCQFRVAVDERVVIPKLVGAVISTIPESVAGVEGTPADVENTVNE